RGRPIFACATREIGRGGNPAADRLALALGELGGGEDQVGSPRDRKPEGRAGRGSLDGETANRPDVAAQRHGGVLDRPSRRANTRRSRRSGANRRAPPDRRLRLGGADAGGAALG